MPQGDKEVEAMGSVAAALEDLEDDATVRVLRWAAQRFAGEHADSVLGAATGTQGSGAGDDGGSGAGEPAAFEDFVDLFDTASPGTAPQRALVGGYWFQVVRGGSDFGAQDVNTALKDLGHGVSNITDALGALQERKPALVRQVGKSGRTRQARKTYKLTQAGITAVMKMLSDETDEQG
jgi:hypothetical protein